MMFNKFGALIAVPAFIKALRPRFLVRRRPRKLRPANEVAEMKLELEQVVHPVFSD